MVSVVVSKLAIGEIVGFIVIGALVSKTTCVGNLVLVPTEAVCVGDTVLGSSIVVGNTVDILVVVCVGEADNVFDGVALVIEFSHSPSLSCSSSLFSLVGVVDPTTFDTDGLAKS